MMKCPYCGRETFDDSVFCGWCGKQLGEITAVKEKSETLPVTFQEPQKAVLPSAVIESPEVRPAKAGTGSVHTADLSPLAETLKDPLRPQRFTMPAAIAAAVLSFFGNLVLFSGITRSLFTKLAQGIENLLSSFGAGSFVNTNALFQEAPLQNRILSAVIFSLIIYAILFAVIAIRDHAVGKKFVFREAFLKAGSWITAPAVLVMVSAFLSFGLPTLSFFAILFALLILSCRIFQDLPVTWNGWVKSGITAVSGFLILGAGIGCLSLFWLASMLNTILGILEMMQ